jgi:predicted ester cyclase
VNDEHKASMRKIIATFATGDLSEVNSLFAEGYVDHQGLGAIQIRGPEGFRRVVTAARSDCPDLQVDIEDLIAEGDRVVVRLCWHGTQADGTRIEREIIDIVRFTNSQAVEHWGAASRE